VLQCLKGKKKAPTAKRLPEKGWQESGFIFHGQGLFKAVKNQKHWAAAH